MAKTISIPDDVMVVLKQSTITETGLKLPDVALERTLYTRVAKVIEAAGGKWNKKLKYHEFPSDPREPLGMAMETGKVDNKQQIFQEFFTPPHIAKMLCQDIQKGELVLEPSAGIGNIAVAARYAGAGRVYCFELQEKHARVLEDMLFSVGIADFLTTTPLPIYDWVLMNPPFTAGQFQLHVQHAFNFLKPGGTLKAIGPKNLGGNRTKAQKAFHTWLEDHGDYSVEPLPADTFKSEGTRIDTVLLTIQNT